MKFLTLGINGFGIFQEAELPDLSPGLNIIEGPNEAGKSTALEFVRALLFGFETGKGARKYEPLNGGVHGGWATAQDKSGRLLRIERNPGGAAGTLEIKLVGESGTLNRDTLLGGADRALFSNVFAFSLRELADIDPLKVDNVRGRIYAAGSGTGGTSILTALPAIEQKAQALFHPRAKTNLPKLNVAIAELKSLKSELNDLREGLIEYNSLSRRQHDLNASIQELRLAANEAIAQVHQAEILSKAWPVWIDLCTARTRLAELPEYIIIPADGLAQLSELLQERRLIGEQRGELQEQLDRISLAVEDLTPNAALLSVESEVRVLVENLKRCEDAREQLPVIEVRLHGADAEIQNALRELGTHWTEENLGELDTSLAQDQEIRAWRDRFGAAATTAGRLKERLAEAKEKAQQSQAVLAAGEDKFKRDYPHVPTALPDFDARTEALRKIDDGLEKRTILLGEMRQVQERIKYLTQDTERLQKSTEREVAKKLNEAGDAVAKAESAVSDAFPAPPPQVLNYSQQEEDLEACALLLSERGQWEYRSRTLQARIEELGGQIKSRTAAHEAQVTSLKAKAEAQLVEAEEKLATAFSTPPEPVRDWADCQEDLSSAAKTIERLALADFELKSLEQRRRDLAGAPLPIASPTNSFPSPFWSLGFVLCAAAVSAFLLDRLWLAAVVFAVGCAAAFAWWRLASAMRSGAGGVPIAGQVGSRQESASSTQAIASEAAALTAEMERLRAVLLELNRKRSWILTDLESVRLVERQLQARQTTYAQFEFLQLEVTRCRRYCDAVNAEIGQLQQHFQSDREALQQGVTNAQNALAEIKGRLEENRRRFDEICRLHGWVLADTTSITSCKRDLRAAHETWTRYQLLRGRLAEAKSREEIVSKEVLNQKQACQEQVGQWEAEIGSLRQSLEERGAFSRQVLQQIEALTNAFGWTLPDRAAVHAQRESTVQVREANLAYERARQEVNGKAAAFKELLENQKKLETLVGDAELGGGRLQKEWTDWLSVRSLPTSITPETCLGLIETAKKARETIAKRAEAKKNYDALHTLVVQQRQQVEQVCSRLRQQPPAPEETASWVRELSKTLNTESSKFVERKTLENRRREIEEQLQVQDVKWKITGEALDALLRSCDAVDEADFRQRASIQGERSQLTRQIHEFESQLEFLSAPGDARCRLEESLSEMDLEKIAVRVETTKAERERVSQELDNQRQVAAEIKVRMETLEDDESLTQKRREVEAKEAELVDLAHQWAVLRLAYALLEKTRRKFERERQPGVVLRAGSILNTLTNGTYAGVIASEGLDSVELETSQGARKRMGEWSRGTAEQLYLALRFALIDDYSKVAEPLPIVMDDVLVHADGYLRLRLAAQAIGEMAQRHQILYFTCRPGDADVLCAENPSARRYRLTGGQFALVA